MNAADSITHALTNSTKEATGEGAPVNTLDDSHDSSPVPGRKWIENFPEEQADRFRIVTRRAPNGEMKLVHPADYDMVAKMHNDPIVSWFLGESGLALPGQRPKSGEGR